MLKELESNEYERVRSLLRGFDYSLSVLAAIEGNNPGRIFVDDADRPHTALAFTVEGYLLAGDHDNPATNEALRCLLREKIFTGEVFVNGDWSMSLAVHPETWEAKLPELIPTHEVEKNERYHYRVARSSSTGATMYRKGTQSIALTRLCWMVQKSFFPIRCANGSILQKHGGRWRISWPRGSASALSRDMRSSRGVLATAWPVTELTWASSHTRPIGGEDWLP